MTVIVQSCVHDLQATITQAETCLELLENTEVMFPRVHMKSDVVNRSKTSTTQQGVNPL